jgi:hypothetical protein
MEATKPCTTFILRQSRPWTPCWEPPCRARYRGGDNSTRRRSTRRAPPEEAISFSSNHCLFDISPSSSAPASLLYRCATHMVETDEVLIVADNVAVVPVQGGISCDIRLASIQHFAHKCIKNVQKLCNFLSRIIFIVLSFVQICHFANLSTHESTAIYY